MAINSNCNRAAVFDLIRNRPAKSQDPVIMATALGRSEINSVGSNLIPTNGRNHDLKSSKAELENLGSGSNKSESWNQANQNQQKFLKPDSKWPTTHLNRVDQRLHNRDEIANSAFTN
ncbi:hypothetical protein ACLOJK_021376 [Asimina triloba]